MVGYCNIEKGVTKYEKINSAYFVYTAFGFRRGPCIRADEKDFVIYKYGLKQSLKGGKELLMQLAAIGDTPADKQHEEQYFKFIFKLAELSHHELVRLFPSEAARFLNLFPESAYNSRLLFILGHFYAEQGKA